MATCGISFTEEASAPARFGGGGKFGHGVGSTEGGTTLRLEPNLYQLINPFCIPFQSAYGKDREKDKGSSGGGDGGGFVMSSIRKCPWMSADVRNVLQVDIRKHTVRRQVRKGAAVVLYLCCEGASAW